METGMNDLLENEWYHVRYSGEIPEIALHSSLYHLTEDSEGPQIELDDRQVGFLLDAVKERYLEIILRDITPENREKPIYRGVLRAISNYRRFKRFCQRHGMRVEDIHDRVVDQLTLFLRNEITEACERKGGNSLNCTHDDLISFFVELGVPVDYFGDQLKPLCRSL